MRRGSRRAGDERGEVHASSLAFQGAPVATLEGLGGDSNSFPIGVVAEGPLHAGVGGGEEFVDFEAEGGGDLGRGGLVSGPGFRSTTRCGDEALNLGVSSVIRSTNLPSSDVRDLRPLCGHE